MANVSKVVREHVGPAFRAFVLDVAATGNAAEGLAKAAGVGSDGRSKLAKTAEARHLYLVLDGGIGQPSPENAWIAGDAAYHMGITWCSGIVFLFAAGHFARFASTVLTAKSSALPTARKAAIIAATITGCDPTVRLSDAEFVSKLLTEGISETSARGALRRFRAEDSAEQRTDRKTLELNAIESAALHDAFIRRVPLAGVHEIAIATCALAEQAPGGIRMQRHIAGTALWHAIVSNGPA